MNKRKIEQTKFKLKLSKRPAKPAHWFAKDIIDSKKAIPDLFGNLVANAVGSWCQSRICYFYAERKKDKRTWENKQQVWLGIAIVAILVCAEKHGVVVTFNTMDSFIRVERKTKPKIDYALGLFHSAFAKWCISVTCYAEPDQGVTQQMLQLQLNAIGLMAYLSRRDPVVDCFMPVYETLTCKNISTSSKK